MNNLTLSNSPVYNSGDHLEQWHRRGYIERDDPASISLPSTSCMRGILKQTRGTPAMRKFEPIHHSADLNAKGDKLLEDWPRRMSCCSIDPQDWQSLCKKLHPKVTFSESSSMQIYQPDPIYTRTKSYTREDRKRFSKATMIEAIRIKRLAMSTPGTTKDSFKCLLKNNIISLEEIVGIEHLVLRKSTSKMLKERQDHARAVLMEQTRIEKMQEESIQKLKVQDYDTTQKLGDFSASMSIKSARRARIRAAMAA